MKTSKDTFEGIMYAVFIVVLIVGSIYAIIHDKRIDKKYGKIRYEFVITDMYDDLGSSWHLVGGRATEQKYHVEYKYRLTNRPELDDNMIWYIGETTVSSSRYRKLHIGQTLYGNTSLFPY